MSSLGHSVTEPLGRTVALFGLGNGSLENYWDLQSELKVVYCPVLLFILVNTSTKLPSG